MRTQPSQECDDEDNCKPSYSGSGDDEDSNDGSGENGDKTMTLFKSNDTNSYVRGLSPGTEKVNFR